MKTRKQLVKKFPAREIVETEGRTDKKSVRDPSTPDGERSSPEGRVDNQSARSPSTPSEESEELEVGRLVPFLVPSFSILYQSQLCCLDTWFSFTGFALLIG